ncbi:MAG: hypothetical protein FRX48_05464 [Lasallia pustulata]|uniref:Uncharacterized protein n=1 Tax=Lasallia pustulata TaxID=136370 RepID=A0A5M8PQD2_9LECA|nr:MAG: hypothetical protein FRX48_05464 [Lasallia pustulata]
MGKWSAIQRDPDDDYGLQPGHKPQPELIVLNSPHHAQLRPSKPVTPKAVVRKPVNRKLIKQNLVTPTSTPSVVRKSSSLVTAGRDAQEKRTLRIIMGEEVARMEAQLLKSSYKLLAITEAMEQANAGTRDISEVIQFTKQTEAELVGFTEEFATNLGHQIQDETKSVANRAWFQQSRGKASETKNYEGLDIDDDWETLEKAIKDEGLGGESPLPEGFEG